MSEQNSFIRNQELYNSKRKMNNINNTISQYPQLGRQTVESVRDTLIKAKQTTSKREEVKPVESKQPPKTPSELERYRKIQSMYNTRINK